nr:Hsp20/alpha crystallin family protein [Pseudomonas sp.]
MYSSMVRMPGDIFAQFDNLHRQMEQLFGAGGMPASIRASRRGAFPAINMGTTPDAVEVYAFVPGVEGSSLNVSIDKGMLTIAGERTQTVTEGEEKANVYARERFAGSFKRVIALPEDADPSQVDAHCRDGVLRITVRKRESSKPRRIEVQ